MRRILSIEMLMPSKKKEINYLFRAYSVQTCSEVIFVLHLSVYAWMGAPLVPLPKN